MKECIDKLNLIFWGLIVIMIDISYTNTINGVGINIDIVNDLIGSIMIFRGVSFFADLTFENKNYVHSTMMAILGSILLIIETIFDFLIFEGFHSLDFLASLIDIFIVYAAIHFCKAMRIFSEEKLLKDSIEGWKLTEVLFFWILLIPSVVFTFLGWVVFLFDLPLIFHFGDDFWVLMVLGICIMLIPYIHSLITMLGMKRELTETLEGKL